jgi:hypothetical protein
MSMCHRTFAAKEKEARYCFDTMKIVLPLLTMAAPAYAMLPSK